MGDSYGNPFRDSDTGNPFRGQNDMASLTPDQLYAKQQELERREKELERREQQLEYKERKVETLKEELGLTDRRPNWPKFRPIIYHDIVKDIPEGDGRLLVRRVYFAWYMFCVAAVLNTVGCIARFAGTGEGGIDFGVSIIILLLIPVVAFVFWYRPLYHGVRLSRSINFIIFFFCFFWHCLICLVFAIGPPNSGAAGFVNGFNILSLGTEENPPNYGSFGVVMISSAVWTFVFLFNTWQMINAFRYYRNRNLSASKAGAEVANAAVHSEAGQQFAKEAGKAAAQGAINGAAQSQQQQQNDEW